MDILAQSQLSALAWLFKLTGSGMGARFSTGFQIAHPKEEASSLCLSGSSGFTKAEPWHPDSLPFGMGSVWSLLARQTLGGQRMVATAALLPLRVCNGGRQQSLWRS